ncbi:MAG: O-antigen ligase family protein, partial [Hyphomicrobiales bacterium]|nr:O-antigen ligase family protein [Hyphomicrobiales bacterium]
LLLELLNNIYPSHHIAVWERRLGLARAVGVFEHPILYGVFCVFGLSMAFYTVGKARSLIMGGFRTLPIFLATFFAVSAGPLLGLVTQMGLILWDLGTRWLPNRWIVLISAMVGGYVFVDILSNRTPIEVLISHIAFQDNSAYNRVLIWIFGTAEVARNPFFGIGLNDWMRPEWMFPTVDNFWLLTAMRYGLPALIFLAWAIGLVLWKLSWRDFLSVRLSNYRKAWVFTLCGLVVVASTVHLWNQVFCLFAFFLGSGVWMLSANDEAETDEA